MIRNVTIFLSFLSDQSNKNKWLYGNKQQKVCHCKVHRPQLERISSFNVRNKVRKARDRCVPRSRSNNVAEETSRMSHCKKKKVFLDRGFRKGWVTMENWVKLNKNDEITPLVHTKWKKRQANKHKGKHSPSSAIAAAEGAKKKPRIRKIRKETTFLSDVGAMREQCQPSTKKRGKNSAQESRVAAQKSLDPDSNGSSPVWVSYCSQ